MKRTDPDRTTEQRQTDGQREIPGALQAELINVNYFQFCRGAVYSLI